MKFKDFFSLVISEGIKKDPRGEVQVRKLLSEQREKYNKLEKSEKDEFDIDLLENPYHDSRILFGSGDEEIKSILVGIDIDASEIILADTLRSKGRKIDMVLAHHPEGKAYATFYGVMGMQADILNKWGIPINVTEPIVDKRQSEVGRKVSAANHTKTVDCAKLLNIPMASAHTVADNQVACFLEKIISEKAPQTLDNIVKLLKEIPEYKEAVKIGAGPAIINGSKDSRAGKIVVDMTGGTEGPKDAIEKLVAAGVGTIVGMHMSEDHLKEAQKYHLNVVIAGHIASDNLGVNLLLDEAEKKFGALDIVECSGFRRFKRS